MLTYFLVCNSFPSVTNHNTEMQTFRTWRSWRSSTQRFTRRRKNLPHKQLQHRLPNHTHTHRDICYCCFTIIHTSEPHIGAEKRWRTGRMLCSAADWGQEECREFPQWDPRQLYWFIPLLSEASRQHQWFWRFLSAISQQKVQNKIQTSLPLRRSRQVSPGPPSPRVDHYQWWLTVQEFLSV